MSDDDDGLLVELKAACHGPVEDWPLYLAVREWLAERHDTLTDYYPHPSES